MADELVSVIIPSYNRPERTQRAIDSVAAQSYSPIELIVVDDGSTDPIEDHVQLPETLCDSKLIRHEANMGANVARNTGIDRSGGEYIAFLDSDDEWKPEKIKRQVSQMVSRKYDMVYTGVEHVDRDGRRNGVNRATAAGDLSKRLLRKNIIGTFSSIIVNKRIIQRAGRPDPDLPCYQDWDWYLRLSRETEIGAIEKPLTIRYNAGDQISRDFKLKHETAYPILRERLEDYAETKRERAVAVSGLQFQVGYAALANNEYRQARRFFTKSILSNPVFYKPYLYLLLSGRQFEFIRKLKRRVVRISEAAHTR